VQVGIVISLALGFQVLSSAVAGAALPLGVRALKLDPAIIATPALTVIVDVTGLLVYFSLASLAIWAFAG
jgi:magnesium transporter